MNSLVPRQGYSNKKAQVGLGCIFGCCTFDAVEQFASSNNKSPDKSD